MHFSFKHIAAIIDALSKFVEVLDQHRFGAGMLILIIIATGILMTVPHLPATLV